MAQQHDINAVPTIVHLAGECLEQGRAEPFEINAAGREKLTGLVEQLCETSHLVPSLNALVRFAFYLGEHERSESAARAILEIAASAIGELERRAALLHPGGRMELEHAARILGSSSARTAPGVERRKIDGAVSVGDLAPKPTQFKP